jgi:hypothetical protein
MLKKVLLTLLLIIILFNKIILSQIILISFNIWLEKDIVIKNLDISYIKGSLTFKNINVFEKTKSKNFSVFYADEIYVDFDLSSLFSTLIIIKNINILNAKLYINFETSKNNKIINDNLAVIDSITNKDPKIYPKKIVDINFLIKKSKIINSRIGIVEDNKQEIEITLSDMNFSLFGNEKNFKHYKDIFKIILTDIYFRIPDQRLRNLIKDTYKIK